MHVHRGNRIEVLVDVLADLVRTPLPDPFARECIVVQGRGMERWLAMELARRLGVWANPDFPFPRRVIERAIVAVLGESGAPAPVFEPEAMRWAIAALLAEHRDRPAFAQIARYLDGDRGGRKRLQLAARIAETFDRYAVYRPRLLHDWEAGGGDDWQAPLWRALVARHGRAHLGAQLAALHAALDTGAVPDGAFPVRLALFGVSTLPPLYVDTFAALARVVDVHLFVLSPSREYWADIRTRREQLRELKQLAASGAAVEAAVESTEGHPLLASLGRVGRDFQHVLESRVEYDEPRGDLYVDPLDVPGPPTLLAALQADLLRLQPRAPDERIALDPCDESVTVYACHGPMREAEVLRDRLTALFEEDATLEPRDVVVMTPSIDAYAPVIEAVFGAGDPAARIPYRIADRRVRATSEVADAFAGVLAVLRGRFAAPEVLDLLRREPVRARFDVAGDDLEVVRRWVVEAGVRWGVDAEHRRAAEQPALEQNTWCFGLDRLLLGYAAPGNGGALFGGVLPYDDIEGGDAALLGKLADLCDTLSGFRAEIGGLKPVRAWSDVFGRVLDATVARTAHNAHEHQYVRAALTALTDRAGTTGFDEAIDVAAFAAELDDELQRGATAQGFLSGGVTFCELLPMRAIPFRVVCLMGMNDDAFPRRRRPVGFDLIARHPQVGDRSPRDDDRYLFLEAILSARDRLIISYVGQRITDNTELPPSVVITELLDTLDNMCPSTPPHLRTSAPPHVSTSAPQHVSTSTPPHLRTSARDHVRIRHPLQPFSPSYFRDPTDRRLFSYATAYGAGAEALAGEPDAAPFVGAPLVLPAPVERQVDVDALARFFEHPSREFLLRRLGLVLGRDLEPVEAREPLDLDALERWEVGDRLLRDTLDGRDAAVAAAALRAGGDLPIGALGACAYAALRPEVEAVMRAAGGAWAAHIAPIEVDGTVGGTRLTGVLRDATAAGLVRVQFSRPGGRAEVGFWLRHLVCNWAAGGERESRIIARPDEGDGNAVRIAFDPVADPAAALEQLVDLYWFGQEVPVPLFERASRKYAEARRKKPDDPDAAVDAARRAYATDALRKRRGDEDDAYVRQLYGDARPFEPNFRLCTPWRGFAEVALAVFGPLLAHRREAP